MLRVDVLGLDRRPCRGLIRQGEDGSPEVSASLARVAAILHESFDPIIDLTTGQDLLPVMVYAQELGAWDYTGVYSAVLQHQVRPAADAIQRTVHL